MSIVIVGGGTSAFWISKELRKAGFEEDIAIFSKEEYLPYNRTLLPRLLANEIDIEKVFFESQDWYSENNIAVYGSVQCNYEDENKFNLEITQSESYNVQSPAEEYKIKLKATREELLDILNLPNVKVIWATGGDPFVPVEFTGRSNILTWRTLQDTLRIQTILTQKPRVCVVGGSFIALELMMGCQKYGVESSTWLVKTSKILRDEIDDSVHQAILNNWKNISKIDPNLNSTVDKISDSSSGIIVNYSQSGVEKSLEADYILLGTGILPNQSFTLTSPSGFILNEKNYLAGDLVKLNSKNNPGTFKVGSYNQTVKVSRYLAQLIMEGRLEKDIDLVFEDLLNTPYQIKFASKIIRMSGLPSANFPSQIVDEEKYIIQEWIGNEGEKMGYIKIEK